MSVRVSECGVSLCKFGLHVYVKNTRCSCDWRLVRSASSWAESWRADCSISSRRETSMGIEFPMGVRDIGEMVNIIK